MRAHFGPYQLLKSSSKICQEDVLHFNHRIEDCPPSTLTGSEGNALLPFYALPSSIKSNALEHSCFPGEDLLGGSVNLSRFVNNPMFSPHFTGSYNGIRLSSRTGELEGDEFCIDGSS
ncbi:uncharacterized protein [Primulina huaijiensis]|uniref:uncharacterized protein n=1 Tax=Primulina huaijiensis TaxID=1492673 RepID=UPI003CC743DA